MARSRYRSVSYDLDAAVEVARIAAGAGGSVAADLLAPALGYSGTNNGAFLSRMAAARLFGVVSGPGHRVAITERGQRILAGREPAASVARREAFLAVPLFRAAAELSTRSAPAAAEMAAAPGGVLPEDLAGWLVAELGESESKAGLAAARLLDSGDQAGLLRRLPSGKAQFTTPLTSVTAVDKRPFLQRPPRVGWPARTASAIKPGRKGSTVADELWLDEASDNTETRAPRPRRFRRAVVVAAAAACLLVVAVPIGFVLTGSPSPTSPTTHSAGSSAIHSQVAKGTSGHQVLSALSATTASGNFDMTYNFSAPVGGTSTAPTTTTTAPVPCQSVLPETDAPYSVSASGSSALVSCPASGPSGPSGPTESTVTGHGTVDVQPFAFVADSDVSNFGSVTVRANGTDVWEEGGGDYGLAPGSNDTGPGSALSGFANLVEGTLGPRQGALAMMGLSSPTGYFDLSESASDGAASVGAGTVDGVAVQNYQVSMTPSQEADVAGLTTEEQATINAAIGVLQAQGFTGSTVVVSIDAAGYIRQTRSVHAFSDGTTMTSEATFSNFGCAGTVLMPGQTGPTAPPAGCVSPDNPDAATVPTTAPGNSPGTSTTAPGNGSTTTTTKTNSGATTTTAGQGSVPPSTTTTVTGPTSPPAAPTTVPPSTTSTAPAPSSRSPGGAASSETRRVDTSE